jgi:hypothetical protein
MMDTNTPNTTSTNTTVTKKTSGISVAAMILGIVGIVFLWAPFLGGVSSLLGIIFGAIGLSHIKKNPNLSGRGMAVTGLVCGIIGIAAWIIFIITIGALGIFAITSVL